LRYSAVSAPKTASTAAGAPAATAGVNVSPKVSTASASMAMRHAARQTPAGKLARRAVQRLDRVCQNQPVAAGDHLQQPQSTDARLLKLDARAGPAASRTT